MPSTMSSSVSRLFASSTVITPSLPTFCIASAILSPVSRSPLAATVPTCAISSLVEIFFDCDLSEPTTASTAMSTPRFRSIGFMPAATALAPSRTMAWASTVAVVVPSPASVLVLFATSRTICAPMFSNLSASSISLATVTPSLVMRGAPNDLSSTTLRPFGPSVTLTASARMLTPRSIFSRASPENLTSLAAIFGSSQIRSGDHAHNVGLFHDDELFTIELDLGARPLAEQHPVAFLKLEWLDFAVFAAGAGTARDDLAFHRLFLRGVGNDDAACGLFVRLDAPDQHAVMQGTEFHGTPPGMLKRCGWHSPNASAKTDIKPERKLCQQGQSTTDLTRPPKRDPRLALPPSACREPTIPA